MAARQRRRRRPSPRRRARPWYRGPDVLSRGLIVAILLLGAAIAALMLPPSGGERPEQPPVRRAAPPPTPPARARREPAIPTPARPERRTATLPARPAPTRVAPPAADQARGFEPRASIVIDDLGQNLSHLSQAAALELPLSIAVLPGLPATARTVQEASRLGIEMLLHQPMEPREESGKNPGKGVLLTAMSAEALRAQLLESLAAVPGAVGVNNHMGSRFTEDPAGLDALMKELKGRGLFWLDSRTTAATRGAEVARAAGVRAIERDIFLDAEVRTDFIRAQVRSLLETARLRGAAVGIGHPHPETFAVLRELRGELLSSGVTLVPVSALLRAAPGAGPGATLAAAGKGWGGRRGAPAAAATP